MYVQVGGPVAASSLTANEQYKRVRKFIYFTKSVTSASLASGGWDTMLCAY